MVLKTALNWSDYYSKANPKAPNYLGCCSMVPWMVPSSSVYYSMESPMDVNWKGNYSMVLKKVLSLLECCLKENPKALN
jgi:hypothetical protein